MFSTFEVLKFDNLMILKMNNQKAYSPCLQHKKAVLTGGLSNAYNNSFFISYEFYFIHH